MIKISYSGTVFIEQTDPPLPPPSQAGVWIETSCDGVKMKAKGPSMAYTLPDDRVVKVQVSYLDAKGHPATVDGDVEWDTSDTAIISIEVDPDDSTIATVVPVDSLGQAQVSATADADLGSGVTEIVCTMDITVVGGQAVVGTITPVGEPTPAHK
jgi:hypothetical protein